LHSPDRVLERGGGLVRFLEQVPLKTGDPHIKPCSMKGNAPVWRAGGVLC